MDDNNELTIYVLQQLRQGIPEQAIRATLTQNGWPQPLIDRAFSMVQQAAPHQMPPTDYSAQVQPESGLPATQVAAELPAPAENPFPVVEEQRRSTKKGNKVRVLLITLLVLVLLAAASFAGYIIYKAIRQHSDKPTQTAQTSKELDATRKKDLNSLSAKLSVYYAARNSYPTLADINDPGFASAKDGFDASRFHDPAWNAKKSKCVDSQGRALLSNTRETGCYGYRVTAMNGSDCDGSDKKCTRVVLTANLDGNKPYILALDQNVKE